MIQLILNLSHFALLVDKIETLFTFTQCIVQCACALITQYTRSNVHICIYGLIYIYLLFIFL